jgi:hypothetical protein
MYVPWTKYLPYIFYLIAVQSGAIAFEAWLIRNTFVMNEGIAWQDAWMLLPLLLVYLLMAAPAYGSIYQHPISPQKGAVALRVWLLILAIASWALIHSPRTGWSFWLALIPSLWFSFAYTGMGKQRGSM